MSLSHRRAFLLRSSAAVGAGLLPGFAGRTWGQSSLENPEESAFDLLNNEALRAIDKGLSSVVSRQNDDGTYGSSRYGRNVAVCSLAGLALMASGSTPQRGTYAEQVDRSLAYILSKSQESGYIIEPMAASHGPMYGHGFATLFLAEVYGMTPRSDVRSALSTAVRLIISTQNADGGWRYQPQRKDADISVTICQIMALRAARNAGIYVPNETVERCVEFVKRSQNPDGGFMYLPSGGPSAFPRSAAGVVALYSAGIYEGEEITKGLEYLSGHVPRGTSVSRDEYYYYGHYYGVQAMWQAGGKYWRDWFPAIRDALIARQREDGSWTSRLVCSEYATAMSLLILQMPNNYLPIFQR